MITKKFKVVKKNKGVKNLNMRARAGWGKHIYLKSKEIARLLCRAERGLGWEAFLKEICEANLPKPAKIKSFLIKKFLSPKYEIQSLVLS